MSFSRATLLLALLFTVGASALAETYVPPELEPWREWVLEGTTPTDCPDSSGRNNVRWCLWPGKLQVDVQADGARFAQSVVSYQPQFLILPGATRTWPVDVEIDGARVPVVNRNGRPAVELDVGEFTIRGRFAWAGAPATLDLSPGTGMVELRVDGQPVAAPRWEQDTLWIGQDQAATATQTQNRIAVAAYRTISDGAPATLLVTLRVDVSGDSREEVLGQLLPDGFTPATMNSPLPARLDADGQLRVQARPGTWEITFTARTPGPIDALTFAPRGNNWPQEELWSYRSAPTLRVTEASSQTPVDPSQAGVPDHSLALPAWRMRPGDVLQIEQRQRGFGDSASNRLSLNRELWMTFDRSGYLARDLVRGSMVRDWRLDLGGPLQLQSAQLAGSDGLLVTRNPSDPTQRGVEVRTPALNIQAVSRLDEALNVLPVSGWRTSVDGVSTELYLPPGTRLIAAPGSDTSSGDWAGAWNLLDFFVLLIISVALWRLYAPWLGIAAFIALALSMHESNAPLWSWLFLVGAFAAHRALPAGRLRTAAGSVKLLSIVAMAIVVVPFAAQQLKLAVYPQLERELTQGSLYRSGEVQYGFEDEGVLMDISPAPSARRAAPEEAMAKASTESRSRAAPAPQELNRYAKSAQVQAGPGVPQWRWRAHSLTWSGPVQPDQTFRLIVLPPWALSLWRIVMVLLTLGVIGMLIKRDPPGALPRAAANAAGLVASVALSLTLLALPTQQATAQTPAPEMLEELKRRLLQPAECYPECVDIERAAVRFDANELRIQIVAHAQARAALFLPGDPTSWHPTSITVDGQPSNHLAHTQGGFAVPLEPGVHRIELRGALPNANAVPLAFRVNPHHITVAGSGFEVTGLNDGRLSGGALTLIRQRTANAQSDVLDAIDVEQFPAFVTVERTLSIDLDWTVTTTVTRVTPARAPINLQIPLLDGESVTSDAVQVTDGLVNVNIGAGRESREWTSTLERRADLSLTAATNVPWQEHWIVNAGASWRLTHEGVPEDNVNQAARPYWRASFTPWPGESVQLNIVRPTGVEGPTLAIEKASVNKTIGRRGSESTLDLSYRATKGGQHVIQLPAGSVLTGVTSDNRALSRTLENTALTLPVLPGTHQLQISWRSPDGVGTHVATDAIDLGIEAANLSASLALPADRWILLTRGPRVGPAVLYWSELLVFILFALILSRVAQTPLKFRHWLILGLGFSTFFWPSFAIVAVTILAFRWREVTATASRLRFNLTQVLLAGMLVAATLALLTTIPLGLLGSPDMHVTGNNSYDFSLHWFVDRSAGALPRASVLSAPLWVYKGLILIWSLWLAFAVLRWLPWLWGAFNKDGYWRHKSRVATTPAGKADA